MRALTLGIVAAATLVSGCSDYGMGSPRYADAGGYSRYDWDRPDPAYNGYDAARYYRDDRRYNERRLSSNERVYVGQDGRYYCRRNDGTTGLIIGGLAGGALGTAIAPGGSGLLGAIIGGVAGAAGGKAIDRNNVRCR
ncbi:MULTISPECIES: hypothetical protein [unclassified Sphingomonas]|uniref:hypothetical protein n=1 Tax=unclassified Sphingomonas TaxID=196159 RepID=UPI0006F6023B|nr:MULTISPECIES: hypothetical protein [unclassified Sphingomonas]KQM98333.1 hypothetical protein ASE78_08855 [Sphingomonas sp. Leaf25]